MARRTMIPGVWDVHGLENLVKSLEKSKRTTVQLAFSDWDYCVVDTERSVSQGVKPTMRSTIMAPGFFLAYALGDNGYVAYVKAGDKGVFLHPRGYKDNHYLEPRGYKGYAVIPKEPVVLQAVRGNESIEIHIGGIIGLGTKSPYRGKGHKNPISRLLKIN